MARTLTELAVTAERFARLLALVDDGKLTPASGREVFVAMAESGAEPDAIMAERGLEAVSDTAELEAMAREVIAANSNQVEQYRGGQTKVLNFFIGQVMKRTRGKASPDAVREIMARLLDS